MTFQNSTTTLEQLRDSVIENNSLASGTTDITTSKLIRAVNRGLIEYQRMESRVFPERYEKTSAAISITTSGYDLLTNITDLGSDVEGFRVYREEVNPRRELFRRMQGDRAPGYYILEDGKLYLTRDESATIYIVYVREIETIALGSALSTVIPIDKKMIPAFEEFVESRFYATKRMLGDRDEALLSFRDELNKYFLDTPARVHILSW